MDYDPTQIKPVPIQSMLLLINQFVVQTTMFLNTFANTVETKICKVRYAHASRRPDSAYLQDMTRKITNLLVSFIPFSSSPSSPSSPSPAAPE
jgi:hypothetical protein